MPTNNHFNWVGMFHKGTLERLTVPMLWDIRMRTGEDYMMYRLYNYKTT